MVKRFLGKFSKPEKYVILGLIAVILISSVWHSILLNGSSQLKPVKGGSIIEGVVGKPQVINPLYSQSNQIDADISKLVFSGLIKSDRGREILPDLAESWSVTNSGKTYIFNLRQDVVWHDGESFDADDVYFTIKLLQEDNYTGILKSGWQGIVVTVLDKYTIQFDLPNASTFFLSRAAVGILPAHLFAHLPIVEIGLTEHNQQPIGTGPYKIVSSLSARDNINLMANKNYYGESPYLDKIVFYFYDTEKALLQAIRNGGVTSAGFSVLSESLDINLPTVNTYVYQLPQYKAVFFNQLGDNQVLKDTAVRRALALSTNKNKIVQDIMDGNASVADSPILPGFWGHLPQMEKHDFDFVSARDVLDKAGWKDTDGDGTLDKDGQKLSFTLSFKDDVINNQIAQSLISDWEAIGINVYIDPVPAESLLDNVIRPRNYDALIFGQSLGSDSDPYVYWHSSQTSDPGLALAIAYDKDIDGSLEMARLTTNLNRAIGYYHEFQQAFANSVPAILLYQPNYVYLVDAKVKGVTDEINLSSATDRFTNILEWFIKYNRVSEENIEVPTDASAETKETVGDGGE